MVFVFTFILISLALPVAGEVWRHRSDNILTRSSEEAGIILVRAQERVKKHAEDVALSFLWLRILTALASVLSRVLQMVVRFIGG